MKEVDTPALVDNVEGTLSMGMLEFEGQRYLDGHASDPHELGLMRGAPPSPDKCITFRGALSISHMRELVPTGNVRRGRGEPSPLDRDDRAAEIDALTFDDVNGGTPLLRRSAVRYLHRRHSSAASRADCVRALLRCARAAPTAYVRVDHEVVRGHAGLFVCC